MKRFFVILFVLVVGIFTAGAANAWDTKFTVTTTNLGAGDVFSFAMSASGTFYVDCGDGGTLSGAGVSGDTITRTGTTEALYTCTYSTGGVKTIRMGGVATGYNAETATTNRQRLYAAIRFGYDSYSDNTSNTLVAAISGSIGQIFPTLGESYSEQPVFYVTFARTPITSIPANLFNGVTGATSSMFRATFYGCTSLSSIPENLFYGITGGNYKLFERTFQACTSLTSIPENLFSGITLTEGDEFYCTFYDCSSLLSIPENLFANIQAGDSKHYTFLKTFRNCSSLSGYVPPSLFARLVADNSPYGVNMMGNIFENTNLATTCPAGTVQYITGYEDYWDGHVSCVDASFTCDAGQYLPAHGYECATCPGTYYCTGGTYQYSESTDSGATACPVADATTARTTYPANYYNPTRVSIVNQDWTTGITSISGCKANYTYSNARGTFATESIPYNTATGKYDASDGTTFYRSINPGYYGVTKYTVTYCSAVPNRRMYYRDAQPCPAGSYCPGFTTMPLCSSGTYEDTIGLNTCPAGLYSPAGMSNANQCGHILHVGDATLYLHGVKKTTPAMHVRVGNDIFYGNMTTADVPMHAGTTQKLKVKYGGVTYSIYDDTVNVN